MLRNIKKAFEVKRDPDKAKILQGFFKTDKGQYGEGDIFLGLKVPQTRKIVAKFWQETSLDGIGELLKSKIHEHRLGALLILVKKYEQAQDQKAKEEIVDFYLQHLECANNWDLIDLSAPKILGNFLLEKNKSERQILYELVKSKNLWRQRAAIVGTYALIKNGQLEDTLEISKLLLSHQHDLIHKAVGWMLRELGKKDQKVLEKFLSDHYQQIPRTTLRYAIERFDEKLRLSFLRDHK